MAYIAPDGVVEIFGDISLAPGQEDTLYFASTSAKDSYFSGLTKLASFSALSYTRRERGYIRVERNISGLYNACYMRYRNSSFENKWFYAFIKSANYINNATTELEFEIDIMMTWMGSFSLAQCFIERQHTVGDAIGANIADEGLETGEYITESRSQSGIFTPYVYCVLSSVDSSGGNVDGNEYTGVYSGLRMETFGSVQGVNDYLAGITDKGKIDAVNCILMLPTMAQDARNDADESTGGTRPLNYPISIQKPYTTIAGYTPRNKKLFCYPYKCLTVYNSEGDSIDYMYEYFNTLPDQQSTGDCTFNITAVMNAQPVVTLIPQHYKGEQPNYAEQISMNDWAACAFNIDSWKAYWAQNKSAITTSLSGMAIGSAMDLLSGAVSTTAAVALGNPTGAMLNAASGFRTTVNNLLSINSALGKLNDKKRMPNISHGNQVTDYMTAARVKDFYFIRKSITKNYAMMIDNYFDMYGYAIKQRGVPNMNARPNWTYVKTIGCVVHGNMPSDDARAIEEMFDSGVRFWKNHANIGNYNLSNSPA